TLAAALALGACSKPPAQQVPPVPVQVEAVSKITAPLTVDANGVVEPMQTVKVQAQVGGTIDAVNFNEGDDVQQGQVLFRLDPRPFEAALRQAQATAARDEATAANAQRQADRYKTLAEKDYVTKSQADDQASASAAANATVAASRAAVENAKINL